MVTVNVSPVAPHYARTGGASGLSLSIFARFTGGTGKLTVISSQQAIRPSIEGLSRRPSSAPRLPSRYWPSEASVVEQILDTMARTRVDERLELAFAKPLHSFAQTFVQTVWPSLSKSPLVGLVRIELTTSSLSVTRSNRLSYSPLGPLI